MSVGKYGQAVSPALTSVFEDIASVFGLHPLPEAMHAQAAAVLGLKGSFHCFLSEMGTVRARRTNRKKPWHCNTMRGAVQTKGLALQLEEIFTRICTYLRACLPLLVEINVSLMQRRG